MDTRKPKKQSLGSLHSDLGAVAARVQDALREGTLTVWADDRGEIFAAAPDTTNDVPTHWISGTFGMGMPTKDIEDDLRALLRERARNWIVD